MKKTKHLPTSMEINEDEDKPPAAASCTLNGSFLVEQKEHSFYPLHYKQTLSPTLRQYYSRNGHLVLLKSLHYEVVTDLARCQELWEEFSPYRTLFDTWDFRYAFYKGYKPQLYFILLKNGENLGILPLQYEADKKKFFWFGSWWQEESSFLVKDPIYIPLLLALAPNHLNLNAITLDTVFWARRYVDFKMDDPKYILDLTGISSLDEYLSTFSRVRRKSFKRAKRGIEALDPTVIIDRFSDFEEMTRLSTKRFHDKGEDADWEDPRRVETFRQVIKLGQIGREYQIRMLSVCIGNKIAGIDLIALYKDCYLPIKCGYNIKDFSGIGNYMNLLEIEDALSLGMKKMDFLEISYGWKEQWFEATPLFKYEIS